MSYYLGVPVATLYLWRSEGRGPASRAGRPAPAIPLRGRQGSGLRLDRRAGGLMQGVRLGPASTGRSVHREAGGRYTASVRFRDTRAGRSIEATAESKRPRGARDPGGAESRAAASGAAEYRRQTTFAEGREGLVRASSRSSSSGPPLAEHGRPSTGTRLTATCCPRSGTAGSRRSLPRGSTTSSSSSGARAGTRRRSCAARSLSGVCGLAVRREALRLNPVRDVSSLEKRGEKEARALTS